MATENALERIRQSQRNSQMLPETTADEYADSECPLLWRMMTTVTENGKLRKRSTVTFYCDDGRLGACVLDRDADMRLHVSLENLEHPWSVIEAALEKKDADWRKARRR